MGQLRQRPINQLIFPLRDLAGSHGCSRAFERDLDGNSVRPSRRLRLGPPPPRDQETHRQGTRRAELRDPSGRSLLEEVVSSEPRAEQPRLDLAHTYISHAVEMTRVVEPPSRATVAEAIAETDAPWRWSSRLRARPRDAKIQPEFASLLRTLGTTLKFQKGAGSGKVRPRCGGRSRSSTG